MGASDLSVQVRNISPKATEEDLCTFFSYCGNVEKIQLQRDDDRSQLAIVTFGQPYAFRTALLLNDAIILDRRVSISPLEVRTTVPLVPCPPKNSNSERECGLIPATHSALQTAAAKGQQVLSKTKDRVSDASKILTHQANTAITSTERTVGSIGSVSSNYVSKGATWLSDVLERASKSVAKLGNAKTNNLATRKEK